MANGVTKEERRAWRKDTDVHDELKVRNGRLLDALDAAESNRNALALVLGKQEPPCIAENWHCPTETPHCNLEKSTRTIASCWIAWAEDMIGKGLNVEV